METKQIDAERDLRDSVTEALAVAGAIARRASGIYMESSISGTGWGPSALFIVPPRATQAAIYSGTSGWIRMVQACQGISPGGWIWQIREHDDGRWVEAEKRFGELDSSMSVTVMLSGEANPDRAIAWAETSAMTQHVVEFGTEGF